MKKSGLVIFIIVGVLIILGVGGAAAGVYFYDFYVFKTLRVCVSDNSEEVQNLFMNCSSKNECLELIDSLNNSELKSNKEKVESMPDFMKEKVNDVMGYSVFCEGTCKVKKIRGLSLEEMESIEYCEEDEKEFLLEIRGKEGLEILDLLKEQKENST